MYRCFLARRSRCSAKAWWRKPLPSSSGPLHFLQSCVWTIMWAWACVLGHLLACRLGLASSWPKLWARCGSKCMCVCMCVLCMLMFIQVRCCCRPSGMMRRTISRVSPSLRTMLLHQDAMHSLQIPRCIVQPTRPSRLRLSPRSSLPWPSEI